MSLKIKISFFATFLLTIAAFYAYGSFSNFKPAVQSSAREVKGTQAEETAIKLPYPSTYEVIGKSTKGESTQITFKTPLKPEAVQTFYRNIMLSKNWAISSTGTVEIFTTTTYSQNKNIVSVTTSAQSNLDQEDSEITIVSLEIKN